LVYIAKSVEDKGVEQWSIEAQVEQKDVKEEKISEVTCSHQ
jgi:hypothetical protein